MNKFVLRGLMLILLIVGTGLISLNIAKGWLLVARQTPAVPVADLTETRAPKFETIEPVALSDMLQHPMTTNQAIGTLAIPELQLHLPVFAGLESADLLTGAGTMFPERNPRNNNMVIVGHHVGYSELLFGGLGQLKKGTNIFLNYSGEDYAYEVTDNRTIPETEIAVTDESLDGVLTLLTCDKASTTDQRIMVKADLLNDGTTTTTLTEHSQRKIPTKLIIQTIAIAVLFLLALTVIFSVTR